MNKTIFMRKNCRKQGTESILLIYANAARRALFLNLHLRKQFKAFYEKNGQTSVTLCSSRYFRVNLLRACSYKGVGNYRSLLKGNVISNSKKANVVPEFVFQVMVS